MAWRATNELIEGILDNTIPGKVTGSLRFLGLEGPVTLDLAGDFEAEISGGMIRIKREPRGGPTERTVVGAGLRMDGFRTIQTGRVDYIGINGGGGLSASWYDEKNGRVVVEPGKERISVEPAPDREATKP